MREVKSALHILKGKPIGKRPLGRPRLRGRTILEYYYLISSLNWFYTYYLSVYMYCRQRLKPLTPEDG